MVSHYAQSLTFEETLALYRAVNQTEPSNGVNIQQVGDDSLKFSKPPYTE